MNKLARVLAILIGVSAIWLLRPDVARADTPMTITFALVGTVGELFISMFYDDVQKVRMVRDDE